MHENSNNSKAKFENLLSPTPPTGVLPLDSTAGLLSRLQNFQSREKIILT